MVHWKFRLPWYALLFPLSQLTLWCYLMSVILSDAAAGAAWIATGVLLLVLCAVADLLLFKALRQGTQLHMAIQRRQLMESSVETQRKRGEALERETAEAVHVRREISARLLEAAELLGAGGLYTFFRIIVPNMLSGILVSALLSLGSIFTDYAVIKIIAGSRYITAQAQLYEINKTIGGPIASAVVIVMFTTTLLIAVASYKLQNKSEGQSQK